MDDQELVTAEELARRQQEQLSAVTTEIERKSLQRTRSVENRIADAMGVDLGNTNLRATELVRFASGKMEHKGGPQSRSVDKHITKEEFLQSAHLLGVDATDEELAELFDRFDEDHSGVLDNGEIVRGWSHIMSASEAARGQLADLEKSRKAMEERSDVAAKL
eukprot:1454579-Prymnesium_polylepis.1